VNCGIIRAGNGSLKPELKPLIAAAYRNALPEGRRFIESQVGELDPGLLASLRAMNPSR
jgi:hypothetical protein